MRAFVALMPPAEPLAELATAVAPVRAAWPGLRWTPAAQWHLTLAFLGEVDERVLPELTDRLARAARRHAPVSLAIGGAGRFGDRVLWVRVGAASGPGTGAGRDRGCAAGRESPVSTGRETHSGRPDGVRRIAASVAAAARRSGVAVDERPYRPHVTLARGRPGTNLRPAATALTDFAGSPWTADALHLVRSRLGAGEGGTALHEVVGTWPLGR